jgi:hypothetical protein
MTIPPFEPTLEGDRVYGRGSYDMKGSVAAVMAAAVALSHENFVGKVLVALVADEEYASIGAQHFAKAAQGRRVCAHRTKRAPVDSCSQRLCMGRNRNQRTRGGRNSRILQRANTAAAYDPDCANELAVDSDDSGVRHCGRPIAKGPSR